MSFKESTGGKSVGVQRLTKEGGTRDGLYLVSGIRVKILVFILTMRNQLRVLFNGSSMLMV